MNQEQPNRRTSEQWQGLIDQQRESGISQKAFCLSRNICLSTFTLWKRKLRQATESPDQPAQPDPDWFEFKTDFHNTPSDLPPWEIELELPGGVTLRMRR